MKRKLGFGVLAIAVIAAIAVWRCHGSSSRGSGASAATKNLAATTAANGKRERVDPTKLKRASIAGTVTDEDRAVVPRARVCASITTRDISAELLRDTPCTTADDKGRYSLGELYAGKYTVAASAKPYRPQMFHPGGDRKERFFQLAAGETKTGVDIVLRKGGVEITGTVSDVTGGLVAHARVSTSAGWWDDFAPPVETDKEGKFSMWVKPGRVSVVATAEGYASGEDSGNAPGAFEILLTPESSLGGTVVDATSGQPVAGVMVSVAEGDWFSWGGSGDAGDITDEQGKFRVTRIAPGRYVANVRAPNGYGRTEGSTLVGLGQHVDGVVIKLHPAYQVAGKAMLPDKTPCKKAELTLSDKATDRIASAESEPDGTLHADGVLPGTYQVSIGCEGYQPRDKYPVIVVKDKDVTGQVWEVDAGATIRGRVVTKAGTPVEEAEISARTVGGPARSKGDWNGDQTGKDGRYELKGLKAATYKIEVDHDLLLGPKDGEKVDIKAGAVIEKDFVLEDSGSLKGLVVDAQGKPVGGVHVRAEATAATFSWSSPVRSNPDGTFSIDGLRPGDYRVGASRGWWSDSLRKPGSTDDDKQGEKVSVAVGKVTSVKLVVESQSGVISGTVVDTNGKPVSDAYISAARESEAAGALGSSVANTRWSWDEKPVISNLDGKFTLKQLSPGKYTLRAYRKGGGEAVAEHVAIGSTAKLVIRATGSLEGVVRRGNAAPEEVEIQLSDGKTGFSRHETFFRTSGTFVIRDLPQGNFTLTAEAEGGKKQLKLDLAEGQQKSGVEIILDDLVNITGRVVEYGTQKPVAGMRMFAVIGKQGGGISWSVDDDMPNISGDDGRFTIERAPRGAVVLRGMPKEWGDSEFGWFATTREIAGNGTVDIGDVGVFRRRVKRGEIAGELGIKFAEQPRDTDYDKRIFKVSYIDPKGPAAKADIKVGDVVTSVDGIDITGANASNGHLLMRAPPGTAIKLGLARGATITIVLAAP